MVRTTISLALVVIGMALPLGEAEACSCLPGVVLSWPGADAVDVPTDTSIVLDGYGPSFTVSREPVVGDAGSAPIPPNEVALFDPAGELVPLHLARQLENQAGCSAGPAVGVPDRELEPNTRYEVRIGESTSSFTTGPGPTPEGAAREAAEALEWQTLARTSSPTLVAMTYLLGPAEVPLFIHYRGSHAAISFLLHPEATGPISLSVGGVACVAVDVVDLRGNTVHTETLCDVDRCYGSEEVLSTSCGGNPSLYLSYEQFLSLPGCAAPAGGGAPAESGQGDGAEPPASMQIGMEGVEEDATEAGCSMEPPRRGMRGAALLFAACVGAPLVRRRRISARPIRACQEG